MTTEDFKRKLTAILSADVVGYSRLMGEDEAATVKTLETYKGVMFSLIKQHRGRVVDSPGDNLLAEFGSVVDAVQCAVSIQKEIQTRNAELPESRKMEFRIGINLGDVIEEDDRIYGDGVNIAARLEALADPGGICVSKTSFDHIESKLPLGYEFLGEQMVKNIPKPIGAYRVLMEPRVTAAKGVEEKKAFSFWRRKAVLSLGIVVILAIVAVLYWYFYSHEPYIEQSSIGPEQIPTTQEIKEAPKTIAVLLFDDFSPEKDQEYFVNGLSEEILNAIDQIPGLTVKARTSSFSFKGQNKSIQEIASLLGVDHVLEGSVSKDGNVLRIITRLIRVADSSCLWTETYDRQFKDIFSIREDIATNIADKFKLTLDSLNLIGGTEDIDAYEQYLKAKGLRSNDVEITRQALESIDKAIDLDPEFALAWSEKAYNHILLNAFGPYSHSLAEIDAGLKAAQKSIEIEPNLADGYICFGYIKAAKKEWIEAELNFRKALELIGESLSGDHDYIILFYSVAGKIKRAQELLEKMRQNDPLNQLIVSWHYYFYGFLDGRRRAEEEYKNRNKLFLKGYSDWHDDSITAVRLGSGDIISRDEVISSNPINTKLKDFLDSPEAGLMELRRIYNSNDNLSLYDLGMIALWASYFGEPELSMDVTEKLCSINPLDFYLWFPIARGFRETSRFKEFVREIGLVDYWKKFGWPDLCRPVGDDDFVCD
jgi:adenylate cyclase